VRIAICGDGPIAHSLVAICGWRRHTVHVLTRHPHRWRNELIGELPGGAVFAAPIQCVTCDPAEAMKRVAVAILCVPHRDLEEMTRRLAPHVSQSMLVGAVPGFGGFGLYARAILGRRVTLFGTQRIPFVVRSHSLGRRVQIGGIRRQTFIGTMPASQARPIAEFLRQLLGVPTVPISHYVNVELSPSNSIMNPARLYSLFGPSAKSIPHKGEEFFADWDVAASRTVLRLDRELQEGKRLIPRDTSFVAPVLFQYDANDVRTLTYRIRRLRGLAGRPVPVRAQGGRRCLNSYSDYVREDIDRGLVFVRQILWLAGAQTPLMDEILAWRQTLSPGGVHANSWLKGETPVDHIDALLNAMD
jgi:opine dehydrogenase